MGLVVTLCRPKTTMIPVVTVGHAPESYLAQCAKRGVRQTENFFVDAPRLRSDKKSKRNEPKSLNPSVPLGQGGDSNAKNNIESQNPGTGVAGNDSSLVSIESTSRHNVAIETAKGAKDSVTSPTGIAMSSPRRKASPLGAKGNSTAKERTLYCSMSEFSSPYLLVNVSCMLLIIHRHQVFNMSRLRRTYLRTKSKLMFTLPKYST